MRWEPHVRFCERLAVRLRRATHLVILCRTPADAAGALNAVTDWTASAGLTLHPTKTRMVDARTSNSKSEGLWLVRRFGSVFSWVEWRDGGMPVVKVAVSPPRRWTAADEASRERQHRR